MSYILDALRKSERERKLSQPASLDSVIFSPEPAGRHPWLPWVLGVVAVANVAALGYFLGLTSGTPTQPQATTDQSPPAPAQENPPRAATARQPPAATAPPFARRFGGADAPPGGPHPRLAAPAARPAMPPPAAAPAAAGKRPATEAAEAADEDSKDETMTGETDDDTAEVDDEPETDEPVQKAPMPATPTPRRNAVPLLSEMPPSFQSRLPQLKINLFAYGSHPDERFAVINMKRRSAGDTVAEGVRLESVDEDSLTLVFEGQRFRLERP
ncbi:MULTISPECIES: general secretion pathway protein GspB [Methylococcus]|uniref:General secretion pathway protein GspB n=1 Tax=Methylococcus capsulatus TaxID=414 RepID=A0ABZ2F9F8_METCP|nr:MULTISPECIES: general secretion pathway protein GspB [Methylococcus]MDF9392612.1 general secretion pathway protein GspB [Methylococcus capsulatus]